MRSLDGVLPRAPTGRPRVGAVGAVLTLCLLGAPMMSLFPVGLWEAAEALTMSGAGMGILAFAPLVAGVILLMTWLGTRWLEGAGVNHPTSAASLVTVTAMATPVFVAFLAPAAVPVPSNPTLSIAVLTAAVATLGMGACMAWCGLPGRFQAGVAPAVVVVAALFSALPVISDGMLARAADERSREQIESFGQTIAVLDHPRWSLDEVHEMDGALRFTYHDPDGTPVYVHTWTGLHARGSEGIRSGCEFADVRCENADGAVEVYRGGSTPAELRTYLNDGVVVCLTSEPGSPVDLVATARSLRPEAPGERESLVESVTG
ncbi:hypothetical protein DFP74_6552 [Nocardiopsis sp. Huas11]|uniref:hypothetical protein n=1 Tax=Nocardiopsis sp. Huas11 TaxID=2183912 RepID=UPI000F22FADF|nr:hypothetical protein [Nocardiopsis sp. Huas11]RKS10770.1 hypothetical protein DFP74_6552 [Nocardiopsis sp. Huas11]